MDANQLRRQVNDLLQNGKYDDVKQRLLSNKDTTEHDNDLAMVCYLCTIHEREKEAGQPTLFTKITDVDELLERYTALKFYLRRIDFDVLDELESFYQFLLQNQVSSYELLRAIDFGVVNRDKVLRVINEGALPGQTADEGSMKMPDKCAMRTAGRDSLPDREVTDSAGMSDRELRGSAGGFGDESADSAQEFCFII